MSLNNNDGKIIEVTQGSDFEIPFVLTQDGTQQPLGTLDTGAGDEITVILPGASGNVVKKLSVGVAEVEITSEERGEWVAKGTEADSLLLVASEEQNIVVKIKRGTEDIVRELVGVLTVIAPSLSE